MASIRQRGKNSYEIAVSCGYRKGKKITKCKTVKLDEGLTAKQVQKRLDDLARDFEKEIQNGTYLDAGKITFEEFANQWLTDHAEVNLRPKTVSRYRDLLKRILPAIGHIKLMKLQPTHLIQLYKNLSEDGMRIDYRYRIIVDKKPLLADARKIAALTGLHERTVKGVLNDKPTTAPTAEKISSALNLMLKNVFTAVEGNGKLSDKTISEHHKLISSILSKAVQWQIIAANPAERVEPPKVTQRESAWYNLKELDQMLDALESEPLKYQVMINIVVYCGIRLGELSVLEWSDIDFDKKSIKISKQLQYLPEKGIYELDSAKTDSGNRSIPISESLVALLQKYREWQNEEKFKQGNRWVEHNKLFTKENGEPIFPDTPSQWFRRFRRKHNLPNLPFHGIRHTNASVMLGQGVDIATVSKRLGHADINVTLRRYAHAIEENNREATDAITRAINRNKKDAQNDRITDDD